MWAFATASDSGVSGNGNRYAVSEMLVAAA